MSILEIVIACGVLLILVLQLILLLRKNTGGNASEILTPINQAFERIERFTGHELGRNREESSQQSRLTREEIGGAVKTELQAYAQTMQQSFKFVSDEQTKYLNSLVDRVNALNQAQATQAEQLREKIETKLSNLQKDNSEQLEKMRVTVDEKLQGTLEKGFQNHFN
jgi:DNA recombination protein RmuC